jgi:hypothetical protein
MRLSSETGEPDLLKSALLRSPFIFEIFETDRRLSKFSARKQQKPARRQSPPDPYSSLPTLSSYSHRKWRTSTLKTKPKSITT